MPAHASGSAASRSSNVSAYCRAGCWEPVLFLLLIDMRGCKQPRYRPHSAPVLSRRMEFGMDSDRLALVIFVYVRGPRLMYLGRTPAVLLRWGRCQFRISAFVRTDRARAGCPCGFECTWFSVGRSVLPCIGACGDGRDPLAWWCWNGLSCSSRFLPDRAVCSRLFWPIAWGNRGRTLGA